MPTITLNQILIFAITLSAIISLTLLYFFIYVPDQQHKNRIKQEAKKRAEVEQLFNETPTGFLQRNCTERCYQDFIDTEMMQ